MPRCRPFGHRHMVNAIVLFVSLPWLPTPARTAAWVLPKTPCAGVRSSGTAAAGRMLKTKFGRPLWCARPHIRVMVQLRDQAAQHTRVVGMLKASSLQEDAASGRGDKRCDLELAKQSLKLRAQSCVIHCYGCCADAVTKAMSCSLLHSLASMCKCSSLTHLPRASALKMQHKREKPHFGDLSRLVVTLTVMLTTWLLPFDGNIAGLGPTVLGRVGLGQYSASAAVSSEESRVVGEAWKILDKAYVDKTFNNHDWTSVRRKFVRPDYKNTEDAYAAIREMTALLGDKFSRFLTPAQYSTLSSLYTSEAPAGGIGVELSLDTEGQISVVSVVEAGPADR